VIGKPILYKTTKEFLVQFGLKDLSELPSVKEFEELARFATSEPDTTAPITSDKTTSEKTASEQAESEQTQPKQPEPESEPVAE
jgi:segregation and condensation protein B